MNVIVLPPMSRSDIERRSRVHPDALFYTAAADRKERFFARAGRSESFGPLLNNVVLALAASNYFLDYDNIIDVAWGHREDGGPLTGVIVIQVLRSQKRHLLAQLGIFLSGIHGWGWRMELRAPAVMSS